MIYTVPPSYGDLGDGFYWVYQFTTLILLCFYFGDVLQQLHKRGRG